MTVLVSHLGPGVYVLGMSMAGWAQWWSSDQPCPACAGVVVYERTYTRDEPRGLADGPAWSMAHVVRADEAPGVALLWPDGNEGTVTAWYADEPYLHPIQRVDWAGPGDHDADGDKDIHDILCYLDWWFTADEPGAGDVVMLADFIGRWFE